MRDTVNSLGAAFRAGRTIAVTLDMGSTILLALCSDGVLRPACVLSDAPRRSVYESRFVPLDVRPLPRGEDLAAVAAALGKGQVALVRGDYLLDCELSTFGNGTLCRARRCLGQ